MTASFGGSTYTASVTAVGNGTFSTGASGVTCNWVGGGNQNTILISQTNSPYYSNHFGPNLTTGYAIPVSAFHNYTGGNYMVLATLVELAPSCFPNAYAGSFFSATEQDNTTY
jgi:hypothetical protein